MSHRIFACGQGGYIAVCECNGIEQKALVARYGESVLCTVCKRFVTLDEQTLRLESE
jgi:hypothetical protein